MLFLNISSLRMLYVISGFVLDSKDFLLNFDGPKGFICELVSHLPVACVVTAIAPIPKVIILSSSSGLETARKFYIFLTAVRGTFWVLLVPANCFSTIFSFCTVPVIFYFTTVAIWGSIQPGKIMLHATIIRCINRCTSIEGAKSDSTSRSAVATVITEDEGIGD